MRPTLRAIALVLLLGAASVDAGETAGDPFVSSANRFGNLLAAAFDGRPLWPGFDGRSVRFLLIDRASGRAAAWGGPDAPSIAPVEMFQLATAPAIEQDGKPSIAVALDAYPSVDEAVAMAIHGAFHLATSPHPAFRLTLLDRAEPPHPVDWKTTYFRREMLLALKSALLDNDKSGLARASHWREAIRRTDADSNASTAALYRVEWVAQYVESVARGKMLAGRGASDNVATQRSREFLRDAFAKSWGKPLTQEDEVRALGAVAGILLRESASPEWEAKVAAGAALVDILLDGITPLAAEVSPVLMESTVNAVFRRNNADSEVVVDSTNCGAGKWLVVPGSGR